MSRAADLIHEKSQFMDQLFKSWKSCILLMVLLMVSRTLMWKCDHNFREEAPKSKRRRGEPKIPNGGETKEMLYLLIIL